MFGPHNVCSLKPSIDVSRLIQKADHAERTLMLVHVRETCIEINDNICI